MSWDVSIWAAPEPPPPVAELTDQWRWTPLGLRSEVRQQISRVLPGVDWTDPHWGVYRGHGFTFEFSISARKPEPLESIMVHVRGGGDAVPLLLRLAAENDWYLLDCSAGEWLHHLPAPDEGWQEWQAFRDRTIEKEN
jgi:hypothetical protein